MDNSIPLFIGFSLLENWLKAIDSAKPVFADLIVESEQRGDYGQYQDQYIVMVAQPGDGDLVYYCRLIVDQEIRLPGDGSDKKHKEHARQVWEIIQAWLKEQGLIIHEAVIATPNNLKLLKGGATFLVFDYKLP